MRRLANIWRLGIKELYSLRHDAVLIGLIAWSFTFSIYSAATGFAQDLRNAAVAIVDDDRSRLSLRLAQAFLAPQFQPPVPIAFSDIDPAMDAGRYTFVLVVPHNFQADLAAGRRPALQLNIDATAMMQAGIGHGYIANIVANETSTFLDPGGTAAKPAVGLQTRFAFNPNIESPWFTSIMEIINNVTVLSIILAGAALIREREHGTIEHLLVMPLTPLEIMMAKVWANGLVIVCAATLSLMGVVRLVLQVPIVGSVPLFLLGATLYLFSSTALGIFLATMARSMPQFGLLFMLVVLPMNLLSGGHTPTESQPEGLRTLMQALPSTHFVSFAQSILYRGAGLDIVWREFALVAAIGAVYLALALARLRRSIAIARG